VRCQPSPPVVRLRLWGSGPKLLVYLDQNFLSEMSKADINEKVRPEFKEIYELLHQGFVDEKLVVPRSLLHDIESSLATHLKERIVTYQHYLGQVRLYRPDEIRNTQVFAALDGFMAVLLKIPSDRSRVSGSSGSAC